MAKEWEDRVSKDSSNKELLSKTYKEHLNTQL
jgi:hypothetical protein